MKRVDYVGRRFGRLVVIKRYDRRDKSGRMRPILLCDCDCGNQKEISYTNLVGGVTFSCGCLRLELLQKRNQKGTGKTAMHSVWNYYKRNAKLRKLEWELNKEEFIALISGSCVYCGLKNSMFVRSKHGDECFHNGIDRVDNNLGYFISNCSTCCNVCNRAKSNMSKEDFLCWIDRLRKVS